MSISLLRTAFKSKLPFLHGRLKITIIVFFILLFSGIIFSIGRVPGTDDLIFTKLVSQHSSMIDWVVMRYQTWSGRIAAESFIYIFNSIPIIYYKLVSIVVYIAMAYILYAFYRLLSLSRSPSKDYVVLTISFVLPYLFQYSVLSSGMMWMTGAMNYWWISVIGLYALYPLGYVIKNNSLPRYFYPSLVLVLLATCSQEQVALTITIISLSSCIYLLYRNRRRQLKTTFGVLMVFVVSIIGLLITVIAPGNRLRLASEVNYWLPDFYTMSLLNHLDFSSRWLLDALINHTGLLLVIIWSLLFYGLFQKRKRTIIETGSMILLGTAATLGALKGHQAISFWFNFESHWNTPMPNKFHYLLLLFWGVVLVATVISPLMVYQKNFTGFALSTLLVASFVSTGILMVSPTMYASGWRTLFVPSMVLACVAMAVITLSIKNVNRFTHIPLLWVVVLASSSQYILLLNLIRRGSWLQ